MGLKKVIFSLNHEHFVKQLEDHFGMEVVLLTYRKLKIKGNNKLLIALR